MYMVPVHPRSKVTIDYSGDTRLDVVYFSVERDRFTNKSPCGRELDLVPLVERCTCYMDHDGGQGLLRTSG